MSNFKSKIPNFIRIIFHYCFVVIGILISLILTIGIIVNFLELANHSALIGKLGSRTSEEYYYLFGLSGFIISIFSILYLLKSLNEKKEKNLWRKFFFIVLLTLAAGGLLKIGKTVFHFSQFKIIGFIPSKITEFLIIKITGLLGTTIFYLFIFLLSIQQLNDELIKKFLNNTLNLIKKLIPIKKEKKDILFSDENSEIRINTNNDA